MKIKEEKIYKYPLRDELKKHMDELWKNMDKNDKLFLEKLMKELNDGN